VDHDTLLLVLSDHGFGTFRRAFDTNTWLWQNGLLTLKNGHKPGEEIEGPSAIDWSRTHAYAVGLGGIYLNKKGRESQGIVEEGTDAERVRQAIENGLTGIPDAANQTAAVRSISRCESLYSGPFVANAPDLLVNFAPSYRVSWHTAVGGFANSLFEDNQRRWSGDHIIAPECAPGILFSNHKLKADAPSIIDLAPEILTYLGVRVPDSMRGRSPATGQPAAGKKTDGNSDDSEKTVRDRLAGLGYI
jgi:predicted AlkP superfamily phosphohydrolase/phosphomutase